MVVLGRTQQNPQHPQHLLDGLICPGSMCTIQSFFDMEIPRFNDIDRDTLISNIDSFTMSYERKIHNITYTSFVQNECTYIVYTSANHNIPYQKHNLITQILISSNSLTRINNDDRSPIVNEILSQYRSKHREDFSKLIVYKV